MSESNNAVESKNDIIEDRIDQTRTNNDFHRLFSRILILLVIAPSLVWIFRDKRVWPWDQAWYGEVTLDLWYNLISNSGYWWAGMVSAFGMKAPGIAWIGQFFVPLSDLVGSPERALLLSNLIPQILSLILVQSIARTFAPKKPWVCWFATLLMGAAPLFVGMSHQYLTESLQLLGVTYFYYLAANPQAFSKFAIVGHLMLATSIAVLAKSTSPFHCFFPGLVVVASLFCRHPGQSENLFRHKYKEYILVSFGILSLGLSSVWYVRNFQTVLEFTSSFNGEVSLHYGRADSIFNKMMFWLNAAHKNYIINEVLILLCASILIGMMVKVRATYKTEGSTRMPRIHWPIIIACLLHMVSSLILYSMSNNEENRFLLPVLPALVVLMIWCINYINITIITSLCCISLAYQWAVVHLQALSLIPRQSRISYWVIPCERDSSHRREIQRIVEKTSNQKTAQRTNIVGVELDWLNNNSLAFYAAKNKFKSGIRAFYTSLGYAESDSEKAWQRLESLNIPYFISINESQQSANPDVFNTVSIPSLRRIEADKRFSLVPFHSNLGVVMFRQEKDHSQTKN